MGSVSKYNMLFRSTDNWFGLSSLHLLFGDVTPSEGPVAAAVPAAVSRQDLLTLEERVARIERILNSHNMGDELRLNEG